MLEQAPAIRLSMMVLLLALSGPAHLDAQRPTEPGIEAPAPPEVAGLVPGTTRRAEVELRFGVSMERESEERVTYPAPPSLEGAGKLHIEYFADQRIARVDVELQVALDPSALAARAGRAVHREQDESGHLVEYFFPSLLGLVHSGTSAQTPVTSVMYLSPQLMADLFSERANDALRAEHFNDALTECEKAVLVAPEYARGYRCRALSLHRQGQTEKALEQWIAATRAPMGIEYQIRSWTELAGEFHQRGWQQRAWEALDEARRLDPSSPLPYLTEATLRKADKQTDQSIKALEEATKRAPEDNSVLARYADGLYDAKRYAEAAPNYKRLADAGAGDAFTLNFRAGFCLSRADKYSEAVPYYERTLELQPQHMWSNNNLGVCYRETGEPARALPLFEKALQLEPDEIIPAKNRIYALLDLGQTKRARDLVESLQDRHQKNSWIMVQVAQTHAVMKDDSKAMKWLKRAFEAGFNDCGYLRSDRYLATALQKKRKDFERLCGTP